MGEVEAVRGLVLAHRGLQPDWETSGWLTDAAARVELRVSTKTYPLPTLGDFARVQGYMVKPVDLVKPYQHAWPEAALNERAGAPDLDMNLVEFFADHAENSY